MTAVFKFINRVPCGTCSIGYYISAQEPGRSEEHFIILLTRLQAVPRILRDSGFTECSEAHDKQKLQTR